MEEDKSFLNTILIVLAVILVIFLPDAFTGDTLETWDGVDHYYNATEQYLRILAIFLVVLFLRFFLSILSKFIKIYKKRKK